MPGLRRHQRQDGSPRRPPTENHVPTLRRALGVRPMSELEYSAPPIDDHVRKMWLQRCRMAASIPAYMIVNLQLDKLFVFAPDTTSSNGDYYVAIRSECMARRVLLPPEDKKPGPPVEEDLRHDDLEFNPNVEPKTAKAWLNLLTESEDAFEDWNALRQHRQAVCQPRAPVRHAARQRISDVLGQLRSAETLHLRQAADPGRGAKIQGPAAGLSSRPPR